MPFMTDIPSFYCFVRKEFLYNLESGHGEVLPVQVFGVDSVEGQAIGFDVITECGAMFARLPIHALCWLAEAPLQPLSMLELWNNFSYDVEAHEYRTLKHWRCAVFLKDQLWYGGEYLFTLSWKGSKWAEDPGQGGFKRAHLVKLDNGNFAAQPNNRMKWFEPSFITKPFPTRPDYLVNEQIWNCEHGDKWATEDSPRMFYGIHQQNALEGIDIDECKE